MRDGVSEMRKGFTLIELSLSIVFIAILSITMVLMINEAISSYRRGITLNRLNTVGMDVVDDIRAAVQNSSSRAAVENCEAFYDDNKTARDRCESNNGYGFVSVTKKLSVKIKGRTTVTVPVYGVFCAGDYSYIWNSGYYFNKDDYVVDNGNSNSGPATLRYMNDKGEVVSAPAGFKLLKVEDKGRRVCTVATKPSSDVYRTEYSSFNGAFDISEFEPLGEDPVEVLSKEKENNLAVYGLDVAQPATSNASHDIFYAVSMILGTVQGGINVKAAGNFCATPEGYTALENFDYCAINKFNFAAQAIGG